MNNKNIEFFYDPETDLFEIFIGEATPIIFNEIAPDLFEGRDKETDEIKGYKIFNFTKQKKLQNINIALPIEKSLLKR